MNWKKIVIILLVIAAAAILIMKKKKELARAPAAGARPVLVRTTPLRKGKIRRFQDYLARVEPVNRARLASRLAARVEKVLVDEGSRVRPGQVLIELDQKGLEAKLESARAGLVSARQNLDYWRKEYRRDGEFFQRGAISEEARDRTKNSLAAARAREAGAAQLIEQIGADLAYTRLTSPYAGVVSRRYVDPGDLAVPGKILLLVEDRGALKLSFAAPQEDAPLLKKGQAVTYRLRGKERETRISSIFPSLEQGRVLRVEAGLKAGEELLAGSFVPVRVLVREKENAALLPRSALAGASGAPFVFLVKDGRLRKFPVRTGLRTAETVEIINLRPPARVVVNPYLSWVSLADGQAVRVTN